MIPLNLNRNACAVLPLVLTGHWFNMIRTGGKEEEYRDFSDYWGIRLANWDLSLSPHVVEFRHGYATNAHRMAFLALRCDTLSGYHYYACKNTSDHPEWGEPATPHYLIRLGRPVNLK